MRIFDDHRLRDRLASLLLALAFSSVVLLGTIAPAHAARETVVETDLCIPLA